MNFLDINSSLLIKNIQYCTVLRGQSNRRVEIGINFISDSFISLLNLGVIMLIFLIQIGLLKVRAKHSDKRGFAQDDLYVDIHSEQIINFKNFFNPANRKINCYIHLLSQIQMTYLNNVLRCLDISQPESQDVNINII